MTMRFNSVPKFKLKADISSTDTTVKLQSIKLYTDADGTDVNADDLTWGATGYGVFEPRTSRQEFFKWTTSGIANATTTGITVSARGLPWGYDGSSYSTEASARKFAHSSGSTVLLFTDAPAMWDTMVSKENNETITGTYTFTSTAKPVYNTHPTFSADEELIDKKYADDLAIAGSPNASTTAKGIVELATGAELAASTSTGATGARLVPPADQCNDTSAGAADANKVIISDANGYLDQTWLDTARTWGAVQSFTADNCQITTDADSANDAVRQSFLKAEIAKGYTTGTAGETLVAGDAVYLKASDGKLWKADTDADESTFSFVGIIVVGGAADATVYYARPGDTATGLSGLTAGSYYYLTATAGTIGTTPGARFAKVAQALSTTSARVIEPKFIRRGTQTITSATTFNQTTGFYPAHIEIRAGTEEGAQYPSFSVGDDTNNCVLYRHTSGGQGHETDKAWAVYTSAARGSSGTVSAKSATGFTLNCVWYSTVDTYIQWVAYSE